MIEDGFLLSSWRNVVNVADVTLFQLFDQLSPCQRETVTHLQAVDFLQQLVYRDISEGVFKHVFLRRENKHF